MAQNDRALLIRLKEHGVQFVIIGGVCGVLHGLSLVTFDLDVCCPFSFENLHRLEDAVRDLHPFHRFGVNKLPYPLWNAAWVVAALAWRSITKSRNPVGRWG